MFCRYLLTETLPRLCHGRSTREESRATSRAALIYRGSLGLKKLCRAPQRKQRKSKVLSPGVGKEMADPCSFSKPSQCTCTNISWFVNVLFEKQILDCRAELDFEVKENGVKTLVRFEDFVCVVNIFEELQGYKLHEDT